MKHFPNMSDDLRTAFLTGILLSGSFERTEQALTSGIAVLNLDEHFREEILLLVIRSTLSAGSVDDREQESVKAYLPPMLGKVLQLPAPLRHCFVLRVLLGWPLEKCTTVLEQDAGGIKVRLIAAYKRLCKDDCRPKVYCSLIDYSPKPPM